MARVAVVGAGFSGTLTAVHLLRAGIAVTLIERSGNFGPGLAYGQARPEHLLNVPAGRMSAFPDAPRHFVDWLADRMATDPTRIAGLFAVRGLYGSYLKDLIDETDAAAPGKLTRVTGDAKAVERTESGYRIVLGADVEPVEADAVVLALGNPPPPPMPVLEPLGARVVRDPWSPAALEGLDTREPVLLVGTGLTMVDLASTLGIRRHIGMVTAVSRHGLIPRPHLAVAGPTVSAEPPKFSNLREAFAWVRRTARESRNWRGTVDGLRPYSHRIWQDLGEAEQARFLRYFRTWWDVHRHRIAPDVAHRLERLQRDKHVSVIAAHIVGADSSNVTLRLRKGGGIVTFPVGRVICCYGPAADPAAWGEPLVDGLLAQGLAKIGPHRLGFDVRDGQIMDAKGAATPGLFAVGPLTRGHIWEMTAIPDLRGQAAEVAAKAAASLAVA